MALSYDDVYTIIAKYANSMLPYYCDSWNRFPVGENAVIVVNYLTNQADWYCDINEVVSRQIVNAIDAIIERSGDSM